MRQPEDKSIDTKLAIRCQLGQPEAWEQLVHRWHPRLWGFIARMIPNSHAAEEVLQVTWLRIVRSFARLKDPEKLTAWMFGLARSAVADHLRTQYRSPLAHNHTPGTELSADDSPDLDLIDQVESMIDCLHPIDREAVVLHYFQHLSMEEIGRITKTPSGTIKSRLNRARRQMRDSVVSVKPDD